MTPESSRATGATAAGRNGGLSREQSNQPALKALRPPLNCLLESTQWGFSRFEWRWGLEQIFQAFQGEPFGFSNNVRARFTKGGYP